MISYIYTHAWYIYILCTYIHHQSIQHVEQNTVIWDTDTDTDLKVDESMFENMRTEKLYNRAS